MMLLMMVLLVISWVTNHGGGDHGGDHSGGHGGGHDDHGGGDVNTEEFFFTVYEPRDSDGNVEFLSNLLMNGIDNQCFPMMIIAILRMMTVFHVRSLRTAHDLGESRKDAVAFSVPQEAFCR